MHVKIRVQSQLAYNPPQCQYQQLTSLHSISRNLDGTIRPLISTTSSTLSTHRSLTTTTTTLIECRAPRAKPNGAGGSSSDGGGNTRPRGGGGPKRGSNKNSGNSEFSSSDGPQRLNKALASAGVASRRSADELIFAGRVSVNDKVVQEPGTRVDLSRDRVSVYYYYLFFYFVVLLLSSEYTFSLHPIFKIKQTTTGISRWACYL